MSVSREDWFFNGYKLCSTILICFYTLMRQTSFKGFSRIKIENKSKPLIPALAIQMI